MQSAAQSVTHGSCHGVVAGLDALDPALAGLASLQVLGCDEETMAAYDGAARFGIHLDDLCDVPDIHNVKVGGA